MHEALKWIAIGGAAWLALAILFAVCWARMFGKGKR
jgi:hypothetical protein